MNELIERIDAELATPMMPEPVRRLLRDCKAALEANGEPVAWIQNYKGEYNNLFEPASYEIAKRAYNPKEHFTYEPLYTAPPNIEQLIAEAIDDYIAKTTVIKSVNLRTQAQPYLDALIAEIKNCRLNADDINAVLDKYRGGK